MLEWTPPSQNIMNEINWLRQQGFSTWTNHDVHQFLRAISLVGTKCDTHKIIVKKKTPAEVQKYFKTFWSQFTDLTDYSIKKMALDILEREKTANGVDSVLPERAPEKCYELDFLDDLLESQVTMKKALMGCSSMTDYIIPYSDNLKEEGFYKEIDQFLVWKMTKIYASDLKCKL